MGLEIAWLALLGLLLAGYFILGGFDYGVQILQPYVGRGDTGRRSMLGTLGPFFLGNEVWLVAFAGVLFGAFPFLEGTLLSGLYSLIVAIVLGVVIGNTAVQLRSRPASARARRFWDVLVVVGGVVPAVTWGLVIGVLLGGVSLGADGSFSLNAGNLLDPFVLLCGATTTALFAAHGAVFTAWRTRGELAARASHVTHPLLITATLLTAASAAAGAATADVRAAVTNPLIAGVLVLAMAAALFAADRAIAAGRAGSAFTATSCGAALPVVLVGAGSYPYVLTSTVSERFGMTVSEAAADMTTLRILSAFGVVLIPLILAYQFWNWWAFRGRIDERTPTYF